MPANWASRVSSSTSRWSIIRRATSTAWPATAGRWMLASHARPSAVSSWERSGSPWWNKIAWIPWYQPVRSPTRARRSRTWVRGVGDVGGWHPGLGQGAGAQQLAQVVGVGAVGLGAPLRATQGAGVGRLGQVRTDPGTLQLLGDEPPAGGGLQREVDLLACEPSQPGAQLDTGGRAELPAASFTGAGVEQVIGDLASVDVEASYDGHWDLLWLPPLRSDAASVPHRAEGVPLTCHLLDGRTRRPALRKGTMEADPLLLYCP